MANSVPSVTRLLERASSGDPAAADAMRRILIEHARMRGRQKRGGDWHRITLDSVDLALDSTPIEEIVSVDKAIRRLEVRDERLARIVRLRFFARLSVREIADALGVTDRTVRREWVLARAWLYRDLAGDRQSSKRQANYQLPCERSATEMSQGDR